MLYSAAVRPSSEIAASGTESVLAFLLARREGATRQWVSKLLVVGEGGVGKTSLIKALLGSKHDLAEATTHGIQVSDLVVDHPAQPGVRMQLSAWDFGGQQIYHATHQFFPTDRSLFLLLWNSRLGWEQGRLEYFSEVLDSKVVDEAHGLLTHAEMTRLWSSLDRGMRDHFLGMMDKYEISFRVDSGLTGVVSLVVERLRGIRRPMRTPGTRCWLPRESPRSRSSISSTPCLQGSRPGLSPVTPLYDEHSLADRGAAAASRGSA